MRQLKPFCLIMEDFVSLKNQSWDEINKQATEKFPNSMCYGGIGSWHWILNPKSEIIVAEAVMCGNNDNWNGRIKK